MRGSFAFSDVQYVHESILRHFYQLDPASAPARQIRQLAGNLRNVQYGRVMPQNCVGWENLRAASMDRLITLEF
jgi:hypothetical protein